jgi:hypothetical protein
MVVGRFFRDFVGGRFGYRPGRRPDKKRKGKYADDINRDAFDASLSAYGHQRGRDALVGRGYVVDDALSGDRYTTWTRNGKAILAFRGTQDAEDLGVDVGVAKGDYSGKAFQDARELTRKVREKYGNVVSTGHSLGGTKALESGADHAIVFNPGSGVGGYNAGKNTVFKGTNDPVSFGVSGQDVTYSYGGGHSLDEFEGGFY